MLPTETEYIRKIKVADFKEAPRLPTLKELVGLTNERTASFRFNLVDRDGESGGELPKSVESFEELREEETGLNFELDESRKRLSANELDESRKRPSVNEDESRNRESANEDEFRNRQSANEDEFRNRQSANEDESRKRPSANKDESRNRQSANKDESRNRQSANKDESRNRQSANEDESRNRQSAKEDESRKRPSANEDESRNSESANEDSNRSSLTLNESEDSSEDGGSKLRRSRKHFEQVRINDIDDGARRKSRVNYAKSLDLDVKPTTMRGVPLEVLTAKSVLRGFYVTKAGAERVEETTRVNFEDFVTTDSPIDSENDQFTTEMTTAERTDDLTEEITNLRNDFYIIDSAWPGVRYEKQDSYSGRSSTEVNTVPTEVPSDERGNEFGDTESTTVGSLETVEQSENDSYALGSSVTSSLPTTVIPKTTVYLPEITDSEQSVQTTDSLKVSSLPRKKLTSYTESTTSSTTSGPGRSTFTSRGRNRGRVRSRPRSTTSWYDRNLDYVSASTMRSRRRNHRRTTARPEEVAEVLHQSDRKKPDSDLTTLRTDVEQPATEISQGDSLISTLSPLSISKTASVMQETTNGVSETSPTSSYSFGKKLVEVEPSDDKTSVEFDGQVGVTTLRVETDSKDTVLVSMEMTPVTVSSLNDEKTDTADEIIKSSPHSETLAEVTEKIMPTDTTESMLDKETSYETRPEMEIPAQTTESSVRDAEAVSMKASVQMGERTNFENIPTTEPAETVTETITDLPESKVTEIANQENNLTELPETKDPITEAPEVTEAVITDSPEVTEAVITDSPEVTKAVITDSPEVTKAVITDSPEVAEAVITDSPEVTEAVITDPPEVTTAPQRANDLDPSRLKHSRRRQKIRLNQSGHGFGRKSARRPDIRRRPANRKYGPTSLERGTLDQFNIRRRGSTVFRGRRPTVSTPATETVSGEAPGNGTVTGSVPDGRVTTEKTSSSDSASSEEGKDQEEQETTEFPAEVERADEVNLKNGGLSTRKPGSLIANRLRKPTAGAQTTSKLPSTVAGHRKTRPIEATTPTTIVDDDIVSNHTEPPKIGKESDDKPEVDQTSRAQELAVTLADPPPSSSSSSSSSSFDTGRGPSIKDTYRRRISTTIAPRTTTLRAVRNRHKSRKDSIVQNSTVRPRRPPVIDYDYYEDEEVPIVGKPTFNGKLFFTNKGTFKCLDQGNFPHPFSCKKFITCARMVNGLVTGAEYTCPDKLSFDPVGGICNWSAGLGCKE